MIQEQKKEFRGIEGVAHKAQPFSIKSGSRILIMLIHGFTGTPYDLRILADFLASNGYDIEVPLLSGHGGNAVRLLNTRHKDWVQSVETILEQKIKEYDKVFLIGYSFGSNIALHLATKYPQIAGIITLGIPIFMRNELQIRFLLPLAKIFK